MGPGWDETRALVDVVTRVMVEDRPLTCCGAGGVPLGSGRGVPCTVGLMKTEKSEVSRHESRAAAGPTAPPRTGSELRVRRYS